MTHTLPELPYAYDALEPYFDAKTMEIHHTKHHQTYVEKLNAAIKDHASLENYSAKQLIGNLNEIPENIRTAVRNHGGGHVNHSFWWPMLKKDVEARGPVIDAIAGEFGSFDQFKEKFSNSAALLFGSGWAWLVHSGGSLSIVTTPNQDNPISNGQTPILGIDVWEHAYYLTYQSRRAEYIGAFFHVINWEKVNDLYLAATA